jgi:TRAP-type mannitol/chloroaromatic compound transport system substrate-binding protein
MFLSLIIISFFVHFSQTAIAAEPPVKLKIQSAFPASITYHHDLVRAAARVKELSGGSVEIEPLSAGQIVPPFELLDATAKGVVDGALAWSGYWIGKSPSAILFGGPPAGPFGMNILEYLGWVNEGGGRALWQEFYVKELGLDVVPLGGIPGAPQAIGWSSKELNGVADLNGLKCRFTGFSAEIWKRLGVVPVNLPAGEIIPSAERGVIDCAEWVGAADDMQLGLPRVWKHYTLPGLTEVSSVLEYLVNGKVWRQLTSQQRAIVEAAFNESTLTGLTRSKMHADALDEMRGKLGVKVKQTPVEILKAVVATWDKIAEEESNKSPFFKKVYDSQREYAKSVVPYRRVSELPSSFLVKHYWSGK